MKAIVCFLWDTWKQPTTSFCTDDVAESQGSVTHGRYCYPPPSSYVSSKTPTVGLGLCDRDDVELVISIRSGVFLIVQNQIMAISWALSLWVCEWVRVRVWVGEAESERGFCGTSPYKQHRIIDQSSYFSSGMEHFNTHVNISVYTKATSLTPSQMSQSSCSPLKIFLSLMQRQQISKNNHYTIQLMNINEHQRLAYEY